MKFSIRLLYLYLFSFIGLIISVIGSIQLVDLAIKVYVFKGADRYNAYIPPTKVDPNGREIELSYAEKEEQKNMQDAETTRQRQRQVSTAISMLVIGIPLFKYHWSKISKEDKT